MLIPSLKVPIRCPTDTVVFPKQKFSIQDLISVVRFSLFIVFFRVVYHQIKFSQDFFLAHFVCEYGSSIGVKVQCSFYQFIF